MIASKFILAASALWIVAALPAAAQRRDSASIDAEAGVQAYGRGDYATAIQFFSRAIASGRLSPEALIRAYNNRCNSYVAAQQPALAKADCDRAVQLGPTVSMVYYNRALVVLRMGQYDAAIADLNKSIPLREAEIGRTRPGQAKPDMAPLFALRCFAHNLKRETDHAIADCTRGIAANPGNFSSWSLRAEIHAGLRKLPEAHADYTRALQIDPKNIGVLIGRAAVRRAAGAHAGAIADLTALLAINPRYAPAFRERAATLAAMREFAGAEADYAKLIEIAPNDASAYAARAGIRARQGKLAEAEADFAKAIALKPNDPSVYGQRGDALSEAGYYTRALADYDRAIALKPDRADSYAMRGMIRGGMGQNEVALVDFDRALQLDARNGVAHAARPAALLGLGRTAEALAAAEAFVRLFPDRALALQRRGEIETALSRHDDALATYSAALRLEPANAGIVRKRAHEHALHGDFAAAALDMRRADALFGNSALAAGELYLLRERAGQKGWADLAKASARMNATAWPGTIAAFLLGNLDVEKLLASAQHEDAATRGHRLCIADYFIGYASLVKGERKDAAERMKAAAERCPKNEAWALLAAAEAKRLTQP